MVGGGILWPDAAVLASGQAYHSALRLLVIQTGGYEDANVTVQGGGTTSVSVPAGTYQASVVDTVIAAKAVTVAVTTWIAQGIGPVRDRGGDPGGGYDRSNHERAAVLPWPGLCPLRTYCPSPASRSCTGSILPSCLRETRAERSVRVEEVHELDGGDRPGDVGGRGQRDLVPGRDLPRRHDPHRRLAGLAGLADGRRRLVHPRVADGHGNGIESACTNGFEAEPGPGPAAEPGRAPAAEPGRAPAAEPGRALVAEPGRALVAEPGRALVAEPGRALVAEVALGRALVAEVALGRALVAEVALDRALVTGAALKDREFAPVEVLP